MRLFNGGVGVVWSGLGAALIALSAAGCGGDDDKPSGGSSADFGALHEEYAHPSGTLSKDDKDAIIAGLDEQGRASEVKPNSAMVGGATAPGPHVLQSLPYTCGAAAGGSTTLNCPCTGSGKVEISTSANQDGSSIQFSENFDDCKYTESGSTVVLDGSIDYAQINSPPPVMTIYKEHLTETVTPPGDTVSIDLNYAVINGETSYSVKVGDGNVLIQASGSWNSTTKSGTFTVVTKDGSTSCTLTNGEGSCTGAGGSVDFS